MFDGNTALYMKSETEVKKKKASKMAQHVKTLSAEAGGLGLISETQMMEGKASSLKWASKLHLCAMVQMQGHSPSPHTSKMN